MSAHGHALRRGPPKGAEQAPPEQCSTPGRECQARRANFPPADSQGRAQPAPKGLGLDGLRTMGERRRDSGQRRVDNFRIVNRAKKCAPGADYGPGGAGQRAAKTRPLTGGRSPLEQASRTPRAPQRGAAGAGGRQGEKPPNHEAPPERRTASPRWRGRAAKSPGGRRPKTSGPKGRAGPRGRSPPPPKPRSGRAGGAPAGPRAGDCRPGAEEGRPNREPAPERMGRRSQTGPASARGAAQRRTSGRAWEPGGRPEGRGRGGPERPEGARRRNGPAKRRRARRAGADPRRGRGPGASGDAECAKRAGDSPTRRAHNSGSGASEAQPQAARGAPGAGPGPRGAAPQGEHASPRSGAKRAGGRSPLASANERARRSRRPRAARAVPSEARHCRTRAGGPVFT